MPPTVLCWGEAAWTAPFTGPPGRSCWRSAGPWAVVRRERPKLPRPIWHGGQRGEREKLVSCYRTSLKLAWEKGCASVAFPLISAGVYGYPKEQALEVAVETIQAFLQEHDMQVILVLFDRVVVQIAQEKYLDIWEK